MFKKLLVSFILILNFSAVAFATNEEIDISQAESGIVKINYANPSGDKLKVMVQKGDQKAFYDFGAPYQYPLNLGSGSYTVGIFKNVQGEKYQSITIKNFNVDRIDTSEAYLSQTQPVHWNDQMSLVKKARELVDGLSTNQAKAEAIYQYLVKNMEYDYQKYASLPNGYKTDPEKTFLEKKGICIDIATLYAAMLRSVNVPTKIVKGYKNDISDFHAWNQVYLEETQTWIIVDITYDNSLYHNKKPYSFIKDSSLYRFTSDY